MIKLILLLFSSILLAHQTGLSYIDIQENLDKEIQVVYKMPLMDTKANEININYPPDCKKTSQELFSIVDGFVIHKYTLWCGDNGLLNTRIWIEGLVESNKGVLIKYTNETIEQTSLLKAATPYIHINAKSSSIALFVEYIKLGISHILSGYDHLLFVLALLLLAKNIKILLYAISAFTISHSITLASAIFGFINISVIFIEAMIALSIVFLARELLVVKENSLTRKHLEYIAFIFGLLHGFGFSNVLTSIGLPQDDIALALLSFNIGIEIGQVLFILVMSGFLVIIKKYIPSYNTYIIIPISYGIGIFSMYWLLERVILF